MELIDSGDRRWIVHALHLKAPLQRRRWWQLFGAPYAEFELELDEVEPVPFEDLRDRLVVFAKSIDYDEDLPEVLEELRAASDIHGLIEALALESGPGF